VSELRASSLPKLAECPVFVGSGGYSEAAERGTRIDGDIRDAIAGNAIPVRESAEDNAATTWGVQTLLDLAGGSPVETREEYLQMDVPGLSRPGTADAVCVEKKWVADIKSGQIRNYREQMAAYSLACMDAHWENAWTAHVVYVDQKAVRSYEFTREQAERIVQDVVSAATSPLAKPTPCQYCEWCANKDKCKALVIQSKHALADIAATNGDTLTIIRERLLASPEQHADFVARFKWFAKEFGEPLTDALKERLTAGEEVPGWKLTNPSPRRYVEPGDAIALAAKLPPERAFLAGGGKMSADTFIELATEVGILNPEKLVKSAPGTPQMRQVKKKEK
jgi:CRISPR/Cas system-associated exonuclease Cas4 (RecB family)